MVLSILLQELYNSEINLHLSWMWDAGFDVKLGDEMNGYKAEIFMLGLSFFGWFLLCILTLGIGFLWLIPYMNTSFALFYTKVLKAKSNQPSEESNKID